MTKNNENRVKIEATAIVYYILCYLIILSMILQGQMEAKWVKNAIVFVVVLVHDG
jgi:hypothetical protein